MQAIQTRYLGPTNSRGSRVKATCSAGSITVGWDYSLNPDENHAEAARALIVKLHWHRNYVEPGREGGGDPRPDWFVGGLDDGSRVFVCAWESERMPAPDAPARPYTR